MLVAPRIVLRVAAPAVRRIATHRVSAFAARTALVRKRNVDQALAAVQRVMQKEVNEQHTCASVSCVFAVPAVCVFFSHVWNIVSCLLLLCVP